jgi:hypothetical protein
MKLITLDDQQQHYLLHVFIAYCEAGFPTSELGIAAATAHSVVNAREVPIETYHGLGSAKMGSKGFALEISGNLDCSPSPESVRSGKICRRYRKASSRSGLGTLS